MIPVVNHSAPAYIAVVSASATTALAAKTDPGPRAYWYQNNGGDTCWLATGGGTATAVDTAGWTKLLPGASTGWIYDKAASTVICAATKTTELSVNGWG